MKNFIKSDSRDVVWTKETALQSIKNITNPKALAIVWAAALAQWCWGGSSEPVWEFNDNGQWNEITDVVNCEQAQWSRVSRSSWEWDLRLLSNPWNPIDDFQLDEGSVLCTLVDWEWEETTKSNLLSLADLPENDYSLRLSLASFDSQENFNEKLEFYIYTDELKNYLNQSVSWDVLSREELYDLVKCWTNVHNYDTVNGVPNFKVIATSYVWGLTIELDTSILNTSDLSGINLSIPEYDLLLTPSIHVVNNNKAIIQYAFLDENISNSIQLQLLNQETISWNIVLWNQASWQDVSFSSQN